MGDPLRTYHIDTSQYELVILGAFEPVIRSARLLYQALSHHQEMTDIVIRPEKIQTEIRLEMRLKMFQSSFAVIPDLILIRIDQIEISR